MLSRAVQAARRRFMRLDAAALPLTPATRHAATLLPYHHHTSSPAHCHHVMMPFHLIDFDACRCRHAAMPYDADAADYSAAAIFSMLIYAFRHAAAAAAICRFFAWERPPDAAATFAFIDAAPISSPPPPLRHFLLMIFDACRRCSMLFMLAQFVAAGVMMMPCVIAQDMLILMIISLRLLPHTRHRHDTMFVMRRQTTTYQRCH